jgi:geranylgeranyl diphosphate synthase type II
VSDLDGYLDRQRARIDRALELCFAADPQHPHRLVEAVRYSLLGGGKRIRPILALAACDAVGGDSEPVLPFACAVEMIHTYSLIHDDLPAMDDDRLRRGRPTNHVVFGEGLAILAGDALLTEAFALLARAAAASRDAFRAVQAMGEIAEAAGVRGMVAGQAADLEAAGRDADLATVEFIHVRKTGALILASVRAGALVGGGQDGTLRALTRYGECLGLAFQIADDILDAEGVPGTGKETGRDSVLHKATFPGVLGLPAAKQRARELGAQALAAVAALPASADPLRGLADLVVGRVSDA